MQYTSFLSNWTSLSGLAKTIIHFALFLECITIYHYCYCKWVFLFDKIFVYLFLFKNLFCMTNTFFKKGTDFNNCLSAVHIGYVVTKSRWEGLKTKKLLILFMSVKSANFNESLTLFISVNVV